VVTTILNLLHGKYGQEIVGGEQAALTINRGKTHDYLGMTLDYSEPGCVKINMTDYVEKVLEEAPTHMDGTATTPAHKNLFEVRGDIAALDTDAAELHYSMVMWLLFLCKRERPDLQTVIAFLCTNSGQPAQAQPHNQVFAQNLHSGAHTACRQHQYCEMVGGCGICCSPQHAESYRRCNVHGSGSCVFLFPKAKDEHQKLDRS
jgi:hypothetical protein